MNEKLIKQLLKGAGFPDTILTDIEKDDFDAKVVIAELNEKHKSEYAEIIKNEIRPDIEAEVIAKRDGHWLGILDSDLKKRGLKGEELHGKKLHEKLDMFKTAIEGNASVANNASAETIKKLQDDLIAANNKVVEKENEFNTKVQEIQKTEQAKTVNTFVDLGLQKHFNSIPDKFIVGESEERKPEIFNAVSTLLKNKYDFSIDDSKEVISFDKGTPKRTVIKDEGGKEYFAPIKTLIEGQIKALGLWKESNGGQGSGAQGQGQGGGKVIEKSERFNELLQKAQAV